VITAQQSLLNIERQDAQIRGQQMTLSVALVKALGGGWNAADDLASGPNEAQPVATKEAMVPAP
jgi:outer membrane protein TolC